MMDVVRDGPKDWNIDILGTDLNEKMVARARAMAALGR